MAVRFFTVYTPAKGFFYFTATILMLCWSAVILLEPFIEIPCDLPPTGKAFGNAAYTDEPCRRIRTHQLLGLTVEECDFGRRILFAIVMGGIIGWERRQSDRPAGIRTMALVSLGACLFTLCSIFAFLSGPMNWDASRVSAAIPSGVGFLGAGLIYKDVVKQNSNGKESNIPQVHGLTTAASLWLSSAVGVAAGGAMYFVAFFCVILMVMLLRFGPRIIDDAETVEGDSEQYGTSDVETPAPAALTEFTPLSTQGKRLSKSRSNPQYMS